jgi:signal transduction histidine kinase
LFRIGLSQFIRRIFLVLLGLSWVGYLGYLLSNLYRSHGELQSYHREQVLRDSGKRAEALAYFFSERSRDLRTLVSGRELQTYFENKALGMSMQYGLSASLYCIRESFDVFRTESRLGDSEIYQRIVFLNSDGTTIVDSRPEGEAPPDRGEQARWAPLLAEGLPSLQALGNELVLVAPYQFKSRLTGHLLAWLSVKKIYQHFVGPDDPANLTTALAIASRLLFVPKESVNLVSQEAFPAIESLSMEAPLGFTVPAAKGRLRELLAFRTPVSGTPLALVTIIPASKLGGISPLVLVAVTGSIGILVVFMGLASVVVNRRALQTMEQLFEKMPFAIVVLAKDRRIGLANEAAGTIFACAVAELKGRPWVAFVPHAPPCDHRPAAQEVTALDAHGTSRAILLTEIPATIAGQNVFLEAFVDQTELKHLESQLRQAQKLEAVGQLAAGIAHEINTPAQYVQHSISFLSESFRDLQQVLAQHRKVVALVASGPEHQPLMAELSQAEEAADLEYVEENAPPAFDRALEGISRIASIVSAMKEFAHPDHRKNAPADLNRALQNTLIVARNAYSSVADVATELGDLPPVMCYLSDLNQAFLSLVVNAAQAIADVVGSSGDRGRILVRSAREGDFVRVEVHDTGCGIPDAIRDRIFDPFFTTKEVGSGTGQGLAIAHSVVVDKHGGTLTFDSTVGKGTVFTIRLPIDGRPNAATEGA